MATREQRLAALVERQYRRDPAAVEAVLPGVGVLLPQSAATAYASVPPLWQTPEEVEEHRAGLWKMLTKQDAETLTREEALRGLQDLALTLLDNSRIDGFRHHMAKGPLQTVLGESVDACAADTTITLAKGKPIYRAIVLRGVGLHLDRKGRLVQISVNPEKIRRYDRLMSMAGAFRDTVTDVSERHDYYLEEGMTSGGW